MIWYEAIYIFFSLLWISVTEQYAHVHVILCMKFSRVLKKSSNFWRNKFSTYCSYKAPPLQKSAINSGTKKGSEVYKYLLLLVCTTFMQIKWLFSIIEHGYLTVINMAEVVVVLPIKILLKRAFCNVCLAMQKPTYLRISHYKALPSLWN